MWVYQGAARQLARPALSHGAVYSMPRAAIARSLSQTSTVRSPDTKTASETAPSAEAIVESLAALSTSDESPSATVTSGGRLRPRSRANTYDWDAMDYHCFQEARRLLAADRADKIRRILEQQALIRHIEAQDGDAVYRCGEKYKQRRLASLRREVHRLKILADINDPEIRRRFEDGLGKLAVIGNRSLLRGAYIALLTATTV